MTAESRLKTTPLHALHRAAGARMVDFGGWEMPLHYGSQLDEHHAVRAQCGMFDVSHMLAIDVAGPGSRALLEYVLANNVGRLREPGRALYSCLLNPDGGVIDDLIAYFFGESDFRLVVNAGTADKDLAWLERQRDARAPDVSIAARRDLALVAVQGPRARALVYQALPRLAEAAAALKPFAAARADQVMVARTGYTGEDGFELIVPAGEAAPLWKRLRQLGATAAGLGARDTLRLEAGMNLYGQDMDESTTPFETGLAWTVDMGGGERAGANNDGRDFIGRAALLALRATQHALGLVLLDKGVMRSHQPVQTAHGAGVVTSGGYGPTLDRSIALARVPLRVQPGDEATVEVRGKPLRARVVKPPFVRHGTIRVAVE